VDVVVDGIVPVEREASLSALQLEVPHTRATSPSSPSAPASRSIAPWRRTM
jgi:hypothetical protein